MRDRLRPPPLAPSRRRFLGGAAAMSLLAACSDNSSSPSADPAASDTSGQDPLLSIIRFYGDYFVAGQANRVPFGLSDEDGLLPVDASPKSVTVTIKDPDGTALGDPIPASIHSKGLPRAYYEFSFEPPKAGYYDYTVDVDGEEVISQAGVLAPDDDYLKDVIGAGDQMPSTPTPTVDDAHGVNPICTRQPPCDLHQISLDQALGTGPVALLVASPAFCQTAICGPVLDVMLGQMAPYDAVTFIHAEVYKDPANRSTPVVPDDFAPVVTALGLPFEPVLYIIGADGVVRERLDYIFDGEEVAAALDRLVS